MLADAAQMGQVLSNLLINAHQAMPSGGAVTIRAESETLAESNDQALPEGGYVRITVSDTGAGIPKANLGRIFDPYFTTSPTGAGLGLAVVFSIVRQHEGSVTVASEGGRGATFTLLLPATAPSETPTPAPALRDGPRNAHVLIMDDEDMVRRTASRLRAVDPNVRALVSSGYSDNPVVANYRSYGFSGAVSKPYTLAEMKRALSHVLSRNNND